MHDLKGFNMISDQIFKRDASGGVRIWFYEVFEDKWRTFHGLKDGALTETEWTVCTPKSQKTGADQAKFEARAEQAKKLARDYRETLADLDRPRSSGIKPMLAQEFEGWTGPCFSQPKLDGVRCLANASGLWSREGKPFLAAPHIYAALAHVFSVFPWAVLDGEFYNHLFKDDFNQIVSLVKKQKPTADDLDVAAELLQYHIYDVFLDAPFADRNEWLRTHVDTDGGPLRLVDTMRVTSELALDALYGEYLEMGYEGQMVRPNGPYEQKRSKQLLKRKEFQDAEYPVVGLEAGLGNWAGHAKSALCRLPDGRTFGAGIRGTMEHCKQLLVGTCPTTATIRFFNLTPDGIPRFPIAVEFDR
jgi:DNA ligase-1